MRNVFTAVLVINFLFETLAGVALISGPQGAFADLPADDARWPMVYGFAALAVASSVFWVWPHRDNAGAAGAVLGFLGTFHTLLFTALAITGNQTAGMAIHGVLALACLALFSQRRRWCRPAG